MSWVVAVRAALPSPRPQGWQALQMAAGLAEATGDEVHLVGDAALPDGGPTTLQAWLGRPLPPNLAVHVPARWHRPPAAGLLFRRALGRLRSSRRGLLCRDPRVAAHEVGRGWAAVVHEWHVRPRPDDSRHRRALDGADLHVAVAAGLDDDLARSGVGVARRLLLPNACGLDRQRAATRRPGGAVVALGLHRRGGLDLALDLWSRRPDLPVLRIAGWDQGRERVGAWRSRLDRAPALAGRIELVGPRWGAAREDLLDDARALLALYPEDDDTRTRLCPLQVVDALGSGLPLVAPELPAIAALVPPGLGHRLFAAGDGEALAEALRRVGGRVEGAAARPRWDEHAGGLVDRLARGGTPR